MMYKRQSTTPFFLYFLLYWAFYDFAWSVLSSIIIFLLLCIKGDATSFFAVLFSPDNVSWLGFLPMMFLLSYYTVGTMVDSVDIDKERKKISIIHSPFFFGKRKITYCIYDENFKFSHTSETKTIKSLLLRWNTELFWNSLHFYKNNFKDIALLHDVCGWEKKQIEDIYFELTKMSSCEKL